MIQNDQLAQQINAISSKYTDPIEKAKYQQVAECPF